VLPKLTGLPKLCGMVREFFARIFPRLATALIVATLATLASIHLFFQAGEPPTPAAALMDLQAGRTDAGFSEIPESATPAPKASAARQKRVRSS